jgi:hypothetical protein
MKDRAAVWVARRLGFGRGLFLAGFLFVWAFYAPPIDLSDKPTGPLLPASTSEAFAEKLVAAEHQKAISQIALNITNENDWFKTKFIMVGAMFAAFFAYFATKRDKKDLREFLSNPALCLTLASICTISLMVDAHIRVLVDVTNQLGLWIANYVEPFYLGRTQESFTGWEAFLRMPGAGKAPGLHFSISSSLILWFHLHCLTWMIYALYLLSLFSQADLKSPLTRFGFLAVHVSFLAVSLVIHSVPPNCSAQYPVLRWIFPIAAGGSVFLTHCLLVWKQHPAAAPGATGDPGPAGVSFRSA